MPLSLSEAFFNDVNVVVVLSPWRTILVLLGIGPTNSGGDQYNDVKFRSDTIVAAKVNGLLVNLYTKLLVTFSK